ncbi:methyltransferase domain-containing protein [Streptomyces hainanensis]|uniref:Methyltransferase domain-containing protein n=1 Tax=Streptomyces hainanensis TaxID=402648 RepID=A0A4V2Y2L1_9ACTN|nr:methyltransferase domain-containing protein [Streptomyces hainanensis]TDC73085.1 methyltransferase domain-containing protein [Streptomyces hainanensis]
MSQQNSRDTRQTRQTRGADGTAELIARLDAADALPAVRALRARGHELLAPAPGAAVADVGCGTGLAVAELAERGAAAVGFDADEGMLAAARARRPGADLRRGDALALPLADGALAGYRADRLLHALPEPARAVREARRVLAPGGRIVLVGQDWEALVIDAADPEVTRRVVRARAATVPSPRAARAHRRLLLDAGFRLVAVEAHTPLFTGPGALPLLTGLVEAARVSGAVEADEARDWLADQRERAAADRLLVAVPHFLAAGVRD